jgi:hypothetical protein
VPPAAVSAAKPNIINGFAGLDSVAATQFVPQPTLQAINHAEYKKPAFWYFSSAPNQLRHEAHASTS